MRCLDFVMRNPPCKIPNSAPLTFWMEITVHGHLDSNLEFLVDLVQHNTEREENHIEPTFTVDLQATVMTGATATIVSGHQAKDPLTIRNGRIGNVNIHFDKNDDAKSTHSHHLISIYMYPTYKYMLNWFRLTYLDAKYSIPKTEYVFMFM